MKFGATFVLVFGLTYVTASAELKLDGVSPSELKEIEKEIANGNVPPNYAPTDKLRRGAAKLTNTDNPNFNFLSTPTTAKQPTPQVRYLLNNQHPYPYYQPQTSYIPLVQPNQASQQIAAQYYNPAVTHFLQTPTQIQYVSNPSVNQVPSAKFQQLNKGTGVAGAATAGAAAASALPVTQQYVPQYYIPQYYPQQYYTQPQVQQAAAAGTTAAGAGAARQPVAQQQPVVMLLINPSPYMFVPQGGQQNQLQYLLGQHPFLNLYGRQLGYPYSQPQVTYLVPMTVSSNSQQPATTSAETDVSLQQQDTSKATIVQDTNPASLTFGTKTRS